jgi:hypothetical protein
MKLALIPALTLITTAAFAQQPSAPPASSAQVAPHKWDVMQVRCSDLLGAADDDRATAAMFYYGYLAASAHIRVIDVERIPDNIAKVMKQCSAKPSLTVPQAFHQALASQKQK